MSNLAINERKPKFKIPIKKIIIKKTIIKLAILLIVLGIAIHLGNRGVQYTQTDQFCASCHNRSAYFETRDASSHARFSCNSCHIQWNELSEANLRQVAREVYVHFTNQQPPDFFLGKVRVEDRICLQCHSYARDATPSGDLIIPHEPHADKKVQCITCHRNIVHGQQVFKGIDATPAIDYGDKMVRPNLDSTTPMGVCMNCHSRRQVSV
ncbi:MAG: NapC/NirT family cytochrome c, partial [Clostridia bacterium]|nr:NapC/NirT family cytochrome c [Clostridia bacterium]